MQKRKLFILLSILVPLFIYSCRSTMDKSLLSQNEIFDPKLMVAKGDLLLPIGTKIVESEKEGKKVLNITLPAEFYFRVDGKVRQEVEFTCDCTQGGGSCSPAVHVNPDGSMVALCFSLNCSSNCRKTVFSDKNAKNIQVELGYANLVAFYETETNQELDIEKLFQGKRVKPIISYARLKTIPSAKAEDFKDTEVIAEIEKLKNHFYTDMQTVKQLPLPKIDKNGSVAGNFAQLFLEVNGKSFVMIVPRDAQISYEYRLSPVKPFNCDGACQNSQCKLSTVPINNDEYLIICSGCPNNCTMSY
ncbi:MAG: hypothetical protein SFU27_07975 [Thermonemataceae bacterium]|nr:hypothetical protein [Thermonemataceae bacterium]